MGGSGDWWQDDRYLFGGGEGVPVRDHEYDEETVAGGSFTEFEAAGVAEGVNVEHEYVVEGDMLASCEYSALFPAFPVLDSCGDPAVAKLDFNQSGDPIKVCRKHYQETREWYKWRMFADQADEETT